MAILYWNFNTNVKKKDMDIFAPQLDELIFKTKDDNYLFISGRVSSFELNDGIHDGKWNGLEYRLEDSEGCDLMDDWCTEDNTQEFKDLLSGAVPIAFFIDGDDLSEHGYDSSFTPTCEKINIDIEVAGVNFSYSADSLIEEVQWLDQFTGSTE